MVCSCHVVEEAKIETQGTDILTRRTFAVPVWKKYTAP